MTVKEMKTLPNAPPTRAHFYRRMALIRQVEQTLLELFAQGRVHGTIHTCLGQEADAVGIIENLIPGDIVVSNHRCHGHYLAFTGDVSGLIGEIMGRPCGRCGGRGGSQHLYAPNFYTNGIQGGMVPNAVGMALAEKFQGRDTVTVVFLGDGTLGQGVVYEAMNLAALWEAPILFVIEHNRWAQSTPSHMQIAGTIAARPRAFGIATTEIETSEVEEIYQVSRPLIQQVRRQQPACLVLHTYRLGPHSKGDDVRDPSEIEPWQEKDPLRLARAKLSAGQAQAIDGEVRQQVRQALTEVQQSPPAGEPAGEAAP